MKILRIKKLLTMFLQKTSLDLRDYKHFCLKQISFFKSNVFYLTHYS